MFKIVMLIIVSLFPLLAEDLKECQNCHKIEAFDKKNHNFSCIECHVLPEHFENIDSHAKIVSDPASLTHMQHFCGKCHQKEIDTLKNSKHYTLSDAINITRHTWGAEGSYTLQTLPKSHPSTTTPETLVDDFLRRKCLKCHLDNKGSGENGMYRGLGCAACHMAYSKDGKYRGSDLTMQGRKPYAKTHRLSKRVGMNQCLSCHNKTFIGTEYLGLFPKDHDKSYRAPLTSEGKFPPQTYGIDFHHLQEDIHFTLGLTCADCHKKGKTVSCTDCHQNLSKANHHHYHDTLACETCHASWQPSHYELSVFRDDTADYKKWQNLILQEDGYLTNFLRKALKSESKLKPQMPDWVTHEMKEGIWYSGWRYRRWEHIVLGNDEEGKVKILRPMFQYRISYRDKNGTMVLDDVQGHEAFLPYTPHTVSAKAKSCEMCHENPLLLSPARRTGTVMDLLKPSHIHKGTPLSRQQIQKLHSDFYKKERAEMFKQ